jgi:hypothetical protein
MIFLPKNSTSENDSPNDKRNKHWRFVKTVPRQGKLHGKDCESRSYEKLHLEYRLFEMLLIHQNQRFRFVPLVDPRVVVFEHSLGTQYRLARSLHWTASHPAISRKLIASITFWLCLVWLGDLVLEFGMPRPHFLQNNVHIG